MLYFSKTKLFVIYFTITILFASAFVNFVDDNENFFLSKKINLGLDLQGGSYILLEVDSTPIINQNLQQKLIELRKYLKKNSINYQNLTLKNQIINFLITSKDVEKFEVAVIDQDGKFISNDDGDDTVLGWQSRSDIDKLIEIWS